MKRFPTIQILVAGISAVVFTITLVLIISVPHPQQIKTIVKPGDHTTAQKITA